MAIDYSQLSREELLQLIKKLKSRKKYGLVWDEERTKEKFEQVAENALPILKEVKDKEIQTDARYPTHILIEGDNYHALSVLNYTHQSRIDVIYIDPPYNTGNKNFKFNDCYVDRDDSYRHSKWLSFMSKRLYLSRHLLKNSGVIFISIDDNELFQLKILCDEIFGDNFVACLPTIMNLKGNNDQFGFAGTHEYTLVYMKNKKFGTIRHFEIDEENLAEDWKQDNDGYFKKGANLKATGINAPRQKRPNLFFPIFVTNTGDFYVTDDEKIARKDHKDEAVYPITDGHEMTWRWSKQKIKNEKHNLILVRNNSGVSFYKKQRPSIGDLPSKKPKSLLYKPGYSSSNGTTMLKNMFNKEKIFNNPKPLELIRDLIAIGGDNNSIILDFMAGSGTTGHATLALNNFDGGKRQFILCTNNEANNLEEEIKESKNLSEEEIIKNGICQKVTYPRIKKAISGYKDSSGCFIDGLKGNLKYFKTSFIKKCVGNDALKESIALECTEMLCLREGIFAEKKAYKDYRIFEQSGRILAIYYSMDQKELQNLKKDLDGMSGKKILYCFTLDPLGLDEGDFEGWDDVVLEAIPQKILDIYESIYEY